MERLKVILEFKKSNSEEVELYKKLTRFSNPGAIVKDILKGNLSIEILENVSIQED